MKKFVKENLIIIIYALFAIIFELSAIPLVNNGLFITEPYFALTLLVIAITILQLVSNQKARYTLSCIFLLFQGVLNLVFIVIFDMTETVFDFGMFNLRNDGMGILENIPMNFNYLAIFSLIFSFYIVIFRRFLKYIPNVKNHRLKSIISSFLIIVMIITNVLISYNLNNIDYDYKKRLYAYSNNDYKSLGLTSNFLNELYKGSFFNDEKLLNSSEIDSFIYDSVSSPSDVFGISNDNNLITVLVESFEWFSFILDENSYPNGLYDLSQSEIDYLFPNLTSFYNKSVVLENNYSRDKTDISENMSIIGSYPTEVYINYDYPNNTIPFALPNIFNELNMRSNSFHNGFATFYNRSTSHLSLGFDHFYASEELIAEGKMTDWAAEGERNLDSEMIEGYKDIMFPTDVRFNTYITSITMHGMFYERENLKVYYDKLDSIDALAKSSTDEMKNAFRNYVAATMEFDKALGIMMEDLENKNLLDNTTIILFGDHNTYYQGLSNYVKDIYNEKHDDYTNLYRVPLMIYDSNLPHQKINKFTSTADIVPTVLDLFGINYYTNLYFGNSVFSDEESILYSRAYDKFLTDKVYFSSINKISFKDSTVSSDYISEIEIKALKILEKIHYLNNIYKLDYFKNEEHYQRYINQNQAIN